MAEKDNPGKSARILFPFIRNGEGIRGVSVKEFPAIDHTGREMSWGLQLWAKLFE
jgi:hypothetical protein